MEMPNLTLSSSPHIRAKEDVSMIMRDVLIALLPATIAAIYYFRTGAIINILVGILGAVLTEYVIQKIMKKRITISDYSAAVTGLLLAFNVPASAPWWMTLVGAIFAIGIAKQLFGGLGHNFINPALAARAVLLASWPVEMTKWITPGADAMSTATPLAILKGTEAGVIPASIFDLLIGNVAGSIGETSAMLILLGGIYLIYRGVITYIIPTYYIATVAILTFAFSGFNASMISYNILAGGLMLGAFFMATDYSSSPVSKKGQMIYAVGCGVLTSVIRYYGGYPEGVSYSILLMNVATPLIDKYISPKVFGEVR